MPSEQTSLILRHFEHGDIDALVELLNDKSVQRFLSPKIPFPYTRADAIWWIEQGAKVGLTRAVQVDGELVGCIGALAGNYEYRRSAEVGYWFGRRYWGNGYAQQALACLIAQVQQHTDWLRLFATVFEGNQASQSVLLKQGFVKEGVLRQAICKSEQIFDAHLFAYLIDRQADE